uniref:Uncharacterized protein n=1 Tax=Megaselia scalaris TaxID=36166 RepID=T1GBB6_MEGSC
MALEKNNAYLYRPPQRVQTRQKQPSKSKSNDPFGYTIKPHQCKPNNVGIVKKLQKECLKSPRL